MHFTQPGSAPARAGLAAGGKNLRGMIAALVLSSGEPTLEQALAALARQTRPLSCIQWVQGVRPFARAFNQGVAELECPYFVQCDADMVLNERAVEVLCSGLGPGVAMVSALLDDPLQGAIKGVKLHRTELARRFPHREQASPETDYRARWQAEGWREVFLATAGTLGQHLPPEDGPSVAGRFLYLGAVIRRRGDLSDARLRLARLAERAEHPRAPLAAVALLAGLEWEVHQDGCGRADPEAWNGWLELQLESAARAALQAQDWTRLELLATSLRGAQRGQATQWP